MSKQEEYLKCYQDKSRIYFIEHFLYTYNAMESLETPFFLFPRQKEFLRSCANYAETIAKKPRQAGITTCSAAWTCGEIVFTPKGSPQIVLCLANKLDQAEELASKIVNFLDQVPRWMWGGDYYSPDPDDPKNQKSIYLKRNKNYIELFNGSKIYARASTPHAARGISAVRIVLIDEAGFLQDVSGYSAARACQSSVADPKCIMVSTPNGKDQLYYKTYSQAVKGENNFHVAEFKWFQDPRYNRFLKWYKKRDDNGEMMWDADTLIDKKGNINYDEERWARLEGEGWTPVSPWFEKMCKSFNNDEQKIAQELLVSFLGSSDNVVSPETIEMHMKQNVVKLPEDWELKDPFIPETWIWKDPIPGHNYICAVDTSSGSGADRTSIEIIDMDAIDESGTPYFDQVLEYNGKMTGDEIGEVLNEYGRMYNDALIVIEDIGGYGSAAILTLMNLGYPNMYYEEPQLKKFTVENYSSKFKMSSADRQPGFRSSGLRTRMIANFVALLKSNTFRVRSTRVISELETWVFKNGRPDHMSGAHDDNLTCLSMGLFVLEFYLMKNEENKKIEQTMLRSWKTLNRYTYAKPQYEPAQNKNFSMPFYTNKTQTDKNNSMVNAMMMMSGFRNPSRTC